MSGAWRFQDERMRSKGLTSEDRTVGRDWRFKASGVDAFVWEMTVFLALLVTADAGNIAQDVPESAAEDIAFKLWHLQRFLDGVGEAVAREAGSF